MQRFWFGLSIPLLGLLAGCGTGAERASATPVAYPQSPGYASGAASAVPGDASKDVRAESSADYEDTPQPVPAQLAPPPMGMPAPIGYPQQPAAPAAAAPPAEPPKPAGSAAEARSKQHLVYTADFTLAVYQVEIGLTKTEEIGRSLGGYLSSRSDSVIVIRVPRERFREALAQVEALGDVVHRDVKAVDVTDEFVDTESRLKNARVMRDRLHALLAKAAVKEAIEIEKELGRVTEQIEVLEGKLKSLSDRIAFSTITVRYAAKGSGNTQPSFRLPFAWVHTLGVHRLLNFQQSGRQ